ncbi:retron St85 family effector protein [Clostridium estertheticum]|uniref:retron St85 family effector protein n=1 Tax=Clostridium estertheticum TaxID=238834 RepID=UPI001C0CD1CC|nr:retron St85 family effector protein [Clostridium estertheticum]MBU3174299.1 retron St85 family effector protein [Clostridium estertheticum]
MNSQNSQNLNKQKTVTIDKIYEDVFLKLSDTGIDIFLCGGSNRKKHIRDSIRRGLEINKKLKVLYPEDLFIEITNLNKKMDLLTLETLLANNSDAICIICESPGSLVELGAFLNNDKTKEKVIVVLEKGRKKDRSFIMLGPIRYIQKKDNSKVIYYDENNLGKLIKDLDAKFTNYKSQKKNIDTIIGLYYLIIIIIYFYKEFRILELNSYLLNLAKNKNINIKDFDTIYKSAIKLMYKYKYLKKSTGMFSLKEGNVINNSSRNVVELYKLSAKGYNFALRILYGGNIKNKSYLYDNIKFGIMLEEYH